MVSRDCGISIAMRGKRVTDVLLEGTDASPVHRPVNVIPRIKVEHVCDRPLGSRAEDAAALENPLLIMEESRVQTATDKAVALDFECTRNTRGERYGIQRLEDVPLVAENGLGRQVTETMQARAPKEHGVNSLYRENAVEPAANATENVRLHQAMQRHTQCVRITNAQKYCKIVRMKDGLFRGCEQRDTFGRYVLG